MLNVQYIKTLAENPHSVTILSGKHTHDAIVKLAWELAPHQPDKEVTKSAILALFPSDYEGNGRGEVGEAVESAYEKQAQNLPPEAETQKEEMMQIASGFSSFHDKNQVPYAEVRIKNALRTLSIDSREFELFMQGVFYKKTGKPIGTVALNEALAAMKAEALFNRPEKEVYVRLAPFNNGIVIDLGDETGNVICISPGNVEILQDSPVNFLRPKGLAALPRPAGNGDIHEIKELLNLSEKNWKLILAYIVGALKPKGPYCVLLLEGEQGSGKSFACRVIKSIVDPSSVLLTRHPKDETDLMIQAKQGWLLGFDNLSGMSPGISDAFCRMATGGGIITRMLYTNDEACIFESCRPVMMNGISDIATRPDLLERSILVTLEPIDQENRKTQEQLEQEFREKLPGVLGSLYSIVAEALKEFPGVKLEVLPRMADFAKWITAAERAAGLGSGEFMRAMNANQEEASDSVIENYALAQLIIDKYYDRPFNGTVGKLHEELGSLIHQSDFPGGFGLVPKSLPSLSRLLKRLKPALRKRGVEIEFGEKTRKGRMVRITVSDQYKESK